MKRIIFLFLFVNTLCFSQQEKFKQLDTLFDLLESKHKAMGSFAIMKEGQLVYNKSTGYQHKTAKEQQKATNTSKYRIGSITKVFTATMIFQLVDEKKIQLAHTLAQYFPRIPNASKISINNLLTHTSGLFNITEEPDFTTWMIQPSTKEQMLARIQRHEIIFEPGEKTAYSNTNFILLGYILEKIEGKSYKKILKERITDKLQLSNTYYGGVISTDKQECQSYYYRKNELKPAEETHMSNPGGAGAIVSTPTDLVIFMDALFSGKLISPERLEQMKKAPNGEMASGIATIKKDGLAIFGHGGGIDGFRSFTAYIPEKKTAFAITLNAAKYGSQPIAFHMFDVINGKQITMPNFDRITLTEEQVKVYEGVYENATLPFDLTFKAFGNELKVGSDPKQLNKLAALKKHEFALEAMGVTLTFDIEKNTVLFNDQTGEPKLFTKK